MSPEGPLSSPAPAAEIRGDLGLVASMIAPGARVLDVGCGDGELLSYLVHHKGVDGRGMELSQSGVGPPSNVADQPDIDRIGAPSAFAASNPARYRCE